MGNVLLAALDSTNAATANFPFNIDWKTPEGVTAIATCLAALFAFLALMSIAVLNRQIKTDHERSRRERAMDLMMCYVTTHDPSNYEILFGLNLSFVLTEEQCRSLWEREPFSVQGKQQNLLDTWRAVYNATKNKKGSQTESGATVSLLTAPEVYILRSIVSNHLNKLELVSSAWNNNVADRGIIEQEFVRIFCPKDGVYVLEKFREASGVYPSIGKICEHFRQTKSQSVRAMPPIA